MRCDSGRRRLVGLVVMLMLTSVPIVAQDPQAFIGQAYERSKKAATAAEYDAILQLCQQALQLSPNEEQSKYVKSLQAWTLNRRGEIYSEQAAAAERSNARDEAIQLDAQALADFQAAIQLDPARWKPWHNRGVMHGIAGKFDLALADFSKVIELNPKYANAWFNRGEIRFDQGAFDAAIQDYSEALRLDPNDDGAYTGRAHAHFQLGQFNAALEDYTQAIRLAPQDATALANRGDAMQSLGMWREAAEDLRRAIQLAPESPRVLQSAAWLMATCPDDNIRNDKIAVEAAERALSLNEKPDARLLDTLAAAYANAGRYTDAITRLKEAISAAATDEAARLKARLQLYQQQQPYRQK